MNWIKKTVINPFTSTIMTAWGLKNLLNLPYFDMFWIVVIIINVYALICFLVGMNSYELD